MSVHVHTSALPMEYEIGSLDDFRSFTMVEHMGYLGKNKEFEICRNVMPLSFELRHKESGLTAHFSIKPFFLDAAQAILDEQQRRTERGGVPARSASALAEANEK